MPAQPSSAAGPIYGNVIKYSLASLTNEPLTVRLPEPLVRIELEEAAFCTLDWANSELIAAGMANGIQPHRLDSA
jgi:hypothetical protein